MAEMVPANQGVVAPTHTPQSAEGTPIVDTSTSSDSAMGDVRGNVNLAQFNQLNQQVRIEKAQILQQQQNVVNLTADPMILAEAQRVVAEVQQEARQSRDQVISEAREFVQSSQELASLQARVQVQASREEISNEASEYVQAITRDFQSQLEVARQYGVQARGQLQDLSARFHQVELERNQAIKTLEDTKSSFEHQMKQMVDRMAVLEQSHGELQVMRSNQHELLHSKNQLESEVGQLRVATARSNLELLELRGQTKRLAAEVKSKDEIIQSLGTQRESNAQIFPAPSTPPAKPGHRSNVASPSNALVVTSEVDNGTAQAQSLALLPELRSSTGKDELAVDDLVEKIFSLETPVVPPVVQDPTVMQLSDKVDKLTKVLASVLQNHQSSSKSNRVASPKDDRRGQPSSPPKSSSSSSSSSGNGGGGRKGFLGGSRSPSKASEGSSPGNQSSSSQHHADPYKSEKKVMRTKAYETLKLPSLPKNAAEARTFKNTIYSMICKLAKTDESPVFAWISECEKPNAMSMILYLTHSLTESLEVSCWSFQSRPGFRCFFNRCKKVHRRLVGSQKVDCFFILFLRSTKWRKIGDLLLRSIIFCRLGSLEMISKHWKSSEQSLITSTKHWIPGKDQQVVQ